MNELNATDKDIERAAESKVDAFMEYLATNSPDKNLPTRQMAKSALIHEIKRAMKAKNNPPTKNEPPKQSMSSKYWLLCKEDWLDNE